MRILFIMRDRVMRVMVFFDLPNVYNKDKRNYLMFRNYLLNEGFIMMQESVYSKIALNEYIVGKSNSKIIDSEDRLIIL